MSKPGNRMEVVIRSEGGDDQEAIYRVTADAFRGRPYAGGDEQDLVNRLRELGQLSVSLVAMDEDQLIGHVAAYGLESTAYGPQSAPTSPLLDIMYLLGCIKGL